jgi:hypothetical protein
MCVRVPGTLRAGNQFGPFVNSMKPWYAFSCGLFLAAIFMKWNTEGS